MDKYEKFFKDWQISDAEWVKYSDRDKAFFGNQKPLRTPKTPKEYRKFFLYSSHRFYNEWKRAGVGSFTIQSYPDSCPECLKMNGLIIPTKDVKIGKNSPPFKCCKKDWCRCNLSPNPLPQI